MYCMHIQHVDNLCTYVNMYVECVGSVKWRMGIRNKFSGSQSKVTKKYKNTIHIQVRVCAEVRVLVYLKHWKTQ